MRGGRLDTIGSLLDVVIQVGRLEDSSYVVRKLGSITQGLHASPSYLKQHPPVNAIADLTQQRVIMLSRSPAGTRWKLAGPGNKNKEVRLDPYLAVADPVIAHQLAVAGLGIAMLPYFLTHKNKSLVTVLPSWQPEPLDFFALYPARKMTPPKLRVFLDELEANLQL